MKFFRKLKEKLFSTSSKFNNGLEEIVDKQKDEIFNQGINEHEDSNNHISSNMKEYLREQKKEIETASIKDENRNKVTEKQPSFIEKNKKSNIEFDEKQIEIQEKKPSFFKKIIKSVEKVTKRRKLDDTMLTEIEDLLISSDLGVATSSFIVEKIKKENFSKELDITQLKQLISSEIYEIMNAPKTITEVKDGQLNIWLFVGVNGSGKTTTLHAMLGKVNAVEKKVWTVEDPVEITQPGLRQMQVNPQIGLSFSSAMRSFLRADPDVIMVGEMRDEETAHMAVEASLTGHLVFSTLHTNNAPETVTRLIDMGMEPFSFSDALLAILAQRLARRLCDQCKEEYEATDSERSEFAGYLGETALSRLAGTGPLKLFRAVGCVECDNSGYRGRLPLHELLVNNDEIREAIQKKATTAELRLLAEKNGMRTLLQDGVAKCLQGLTDLKQVLAVCSR